MVRCACDPGADGSGGETVVDHIRLFPLRPDVRWTYRVHEQILPALRRAGIPVRWTDLVVRHTGYVDVALRARKLERDTRILLEELKDRPDEPFILFNLGAIAIERKDWRGALGYLAQEPGALGAERLDHAEAVRPDRPGAPDAGRRRARRCGSAPRGWRSTPRTPSCCSARRWSTGSGASRPRRKRCWRTILGLARPEQFASVDMGIYGHLTRRNLAALAAERGDREEEARLWRAVLAECPGDREAACRAGAAGARRTEGL